MSHSIAIARTLRWTGIILFVASFLTPQIEFGYAGLTVSAKDCGFYAFMWTPVLLVSLLGGGDFPCALLMLLVWLNNLSVFLKLPRP